MLASNSTAAATLSLANSDVSLLNYQSALYPSSAAPVAGVAQQSVSLQPGTTQICTQTDPFQQTFIVCPPAFQSKPRTLGVWCCGFSQFRLEKLWFTLNWENPDLSRALCGCHTGLLHQMQVQNQVRHVQAAWFPSRPCWNRWQDLACLGCRLQLVAQPVFPPKLNTAAFHRKQGTEEPDLPGSQCVLMCLLSQEQISGVWASVHFPDAAFCYQQVVTGCGSVSTGSSVHASAHPQGSVVMLIPGLF